MNPRKQKRFLFQFHETHGVSIKGNVLCVCVCVCVCERERERERERGYQCQELRVCLNIACFAEIENLLLKVL